MAFGLSRLRDLLALAESGIALDALLVPKVESAADLHCLGAWLGDRAPAVGRPPRTPSAIEQAGRIAGAGSPTAALMLGGADLSAEIGANFDWTGLLHARGRLVNAAKAAGLQAWDVPHIALDDVDDLVEETRRAIAMGFDCKTAIHPRQIDPIHSAFAPTAAEAEWAKALLQAMPADGASGAFLFQGRMVDAPVIRKAHRIVARAASNRSQPQEADPMVQTAKKVGENRYRESFGRHYEEFAIGDIYEHRPGRTISETDNRWFTLLTMNTHPMHFDEEYARASEFGKCIVCSPFTVALLVGMSVTDVSQKAIANLGWTDITLTAPVFAGDTLYSESEVLDKRESKSRPGAGIVTVRTTGINQDGKVVGNFVRKILIAKRGQSVEDRVDY